MIMNVGIVWLLLLVRFFVPVRDGMEWDGIGTNACRFMYKVASVAAQIRLGQLVVFFFPWCVSLCSHVRARVLRCGTIRNAAYYAVCNTISNVANEGGAYRSLLHYYILTKVFSPGL